MRHSITIIGGDSFIAQNLIAELIKKKYNLKIFSRNKTSYKDEVLLSDFFTLKAEDFNNSTTILNFAAIVHQKDNKNIELYHRINTKLPIHLATEAKKAGVLHYIQMSTLSVYDYSERIINIKTPEKPTTIYGTSKLKADRELLKMQSDNFIVSLIRPPIVYGGKNTPGNMTKIIKFAIKGIPVPFKNVHNKRDFIHIGNLVNCLNICIEKHLNLIIIPTDRKSVSTSELFDIIKKHSKHKIRLFKPPAIFLFLLKKLKPDLYDKLFESLTVECNIDPILYEPKFKIKDGILEMIKDIEEY